MTEINYDKIARVLDGESLPLDATELTVLQELRASDDLLAPLAKELTPPHFEHLMHKPLQLIARRRFLPRCIRAFATSSSVAAAIAILILTVSVAKTNFVDSDIPAEQLWALGFEQTSMANEEFDIRASYLAEELNKNSVELFVETAIVPSPEETMLDSGIDSVESQLQDFWTTDESPLTDFDAFMDSHTHQGSAS